MVKPGIIMIGSQLFIKIEQVPIPIQSACLVKAIGMLIAVYYVLSEHYPSDLVNVMFFLNTCLICLFPGLE